MRITVIIDDQLLAQAKRLAAQTGKSLSTVVEDALRQMLTGLQQKPDRASVQLTTVSGSGLMPGVELDDSSALLDLMEKPDGRSRL